MENLESREERRPRARPTRAEVEPAALDLLRRYGPGILGTARRYSLTPEDADDAYQRGLEILLTKAPSTDHEDLLPWLKTVVKHEAFAIRRQRERNGVPTEDALEEAVAAASGPDEQAERYERLQLGAEALSRLKPQEIRCLLLRAEGYSYRQICQETGWTYTKVNRCLTEGRRSFLAQITGIEAGAECKRLSPLLSALADGEATHRDLLTLRPHLRSCLACRATLRQYRSVPARVTAGVAPIASVPDADMPGSVSRSFDFVVSWLQERSLLLGMKAQQAVEMASAGKVAAVAASTAALAGGGVATINSLEHERDRPEKSDREPRREPPPAPVRPVERPLPARPDPSRSKRRDPTPTAPPQPPASAAASAPPPQRSGASSQGSAPAAAPAPRRPSRSAGTGSPTSAETSAPPQSDGDTEEAGVKPEAEYGF